MHRALSWPHACMHYNCLFTDEHAGQETQETCAIHHVLNEYRSVSSSCTLSSPGWPLLRGRMWSPSGTGTRARWGVCLATGHAATQRQGAAGGSAEHESWDWHTHPVLGAACACVFICNHSSISHEETPLFRARAQVIQQFQLGAMGEEDMCGDADLSRLHSRDPEHSVNPSAVASATSRWVLLCYFQGQSPNKRYIVRFVGGSEEGPALHVFMLSLERGNLGGSLFAQKKYGLLCSGS